MIGCTADEAKRTPTIVRVSPSNTGVSSSPEAFSEAYPTSVRVRPTRVRGF